MRAVTQLPMMSMAALFLPNAWPLQPAPTCDGNFMMPAVSMPLRKVSAATFCGLSSSTLRAGGADDGSAVLVEELVDAGVGLVDGSGRLGWAVVSFFATASSWLQLGMRLRQPGLLPVGGVDVQGEGAGVLGLAVNLPL